MTITIGVSLKAYLGYLQTVSWAAGVAEVIGGRRSDLELFVLPSYPALAEANRRGDRSDVGRARLPLRGGRAC